MLFSDGCKTSIPDFFRSCDSCEIDLCLYCCKDIRDGKLKRVEVGDTDSGRNWTSVDSGEITCGKCEANKMKLCTLFVHGFVAKLISDAANLVDKSEISKELKNLPCHICVENIKKFQEAEKEAQLPIEEDGLPTSEQAKLQNKESVRKASSRPDNSSNFLWCPSYDDLKIEEHGPALVHFQQHWKLGEPVIVRDLLSKWNGLSWEPDVMHRAFREMGKRGKSLEESKDVYAIDCFEWSQVNFET